MFLRLLGGASLERLGTPVRSRATHRRRIAMLALLAASRQRSLGREKIIAMLWPEHPAEGGRRLLSESLYLLRRELGERAFMVSGDEIRLAGDAFGCDLWALDEAFERGDLTGAAEAYLGEFLDGFFVNDAGEFEQWVTRERDRIARRHASTCERLATNAEQADDWPAAVNWWQHVVDREPDSPRLVLRLMAALEAHGDRHRALIVAQRHIDYLREQLESDPDPAIDQAVKRLRRVPARLSVLPLTFESAAPASVSAEPPPSDDPANGAEGDASGVDASSGLSASDTTVPQFFAAETVIPASQASTFAANPELGRVPRSDHRAVRWATFAVVVLAMLAVSFRSKWSEPGGETSVASKASTEPDPRRVAVLYFDDLSPDRSLGYLADGLTESLIQELSRIPSLQVVPRNGTRSFRDRPVPLDSAVRVLRAGSIVEGSVQQSAGRLRVRVQLIDGRSGTTLQSRSVERPIGELFALEDAVAQEASESLRQRLGQEIRRRDRIASTHSATARAFQLRAERLMSEIIDSPLMKSSATAIAQARLDSAEHLLDLAKREDVRWHQPLLAIGRLRLARARIAADSSVMSDLYADAVSHATQALRLLPGDPDGLELRGVAMWHRIHLGGLSAAGGTDSLLESAETDLRSALSKDPRRASAWSALSQLQRLRGRFAEADDAGRRALEADEFLEEAPNIVERLYRSALTLGRFVEATSWCNRGATSYRNDWRFAECRLVLAASDPNVRPDPPNAWRLWRELGQLDPPDHAARQGRRYSPVFRRMVVARVLARAALADSARAEVERARQLVGSDLKLARSFLYDEAIVSLYLGDSERAVRLVSEYVRVNPHLRAYLRNDVLLEPIRDHPNFRAALKS
jgi:serine/threonine-protein kinase